MLNMYSYVFIFTLWKQLTVQNAKVRISIKVALQKGVSDFCVKTAITFFR